MQYTQSNTSTQAVNISSLRRSANGPPTIRRRSADLPHCDVFTNLESANPAFFQQKLLFVTICSK